MRCEKMHATIRVQQCLANQQQKAGIDGGKATSLRYPGCQDCATGARARAGELNDDDWREIIAGYHARMNPPEEVVQRTAEPQNRRTSNRRSKKPTKEEVVMEEVRGEALGVRGEESTEAEARKTCIKCGETKPLEQFCKEKKARDGHRGICLECNKLYQQEWRDKKQAKAIEAAIGEKAKVGANSRSPLPAQPAPAKPDIVPGEGVGSNGRSTLPAPVPRQEMPGDISLTLTLDFSIYPEVLEEIKHLAVWEERPPEVQARLMLRRLLRPGTDERRLAKSNGERYQPMFLAATPDRPEAACA